MLGIDLGNPDTEFLMPGEELVGTDSGSHAYFIDPDGDVQ
jgi:hypothetical protein